MKAVQKETKTKQGFTLIELLIVIAIIGLLASVVMVSLSSARSRARDAKRKAELKQVAAALELYYNNYNTYLVTDPLTGRITGYPTCSCGWFSHDYGNGSVGQGLVNAGTLSSNPHDPGGSDTGGAVQGRSGYMIYLCNGDQGYSLYASLENPTAADVATYTSACAGQVGYTMNYSVSSR